MWLSATLLAPAILQLKEDSMAKWLTFLAFTLLALQLGEAGATPSFTSFSQTEILISPF
jgi:hypothetical protein